MSCISQLEKQRRAPGPAGGLTLSEGSTFQSWATSDSVKMSSGAVLDFSLGGARRLRITAPVLGFRTERLSHAVTAVRSNRVLRVDSPGHDADVEMMLRTSMIVRTRAQRRGGHFVHICPVRWLLHWEQTARLLPFTLQLLKQKNS